jgi:hypothetical protein
MKLRASSMLLFFGTLMFICLSVCFASASDSERYQQGTLVRSEACGPEFCQTVVVQAGDMVYVGIHKTNFPWNAYAAHEFVENGDVEFRISGDALMLKRPNGKELKARLTKRVKVDPSKPWTTRELHPTDNGRSMGMQMTGW